MKLLRLMGAREGSLDQPHAWNKTTHPENVDVSLDALLHNKLYR